MYACLAGAAPLSSDLRRDRDKLVPAAKRWHKKYSQQLLETIDWCMQLNQTVRPQSVFVLQRALSEKHHAVPNSSWVGTLKERLRGLIVG
jgi:hypothetical protein